MSEQDQDYYKNFGVATEETPTKFSLLEKGCGCLTTVGILCFLLFVGSSWVSCTYKHIRDDWREPGVEVHSNR